MASIRKLKKDINTLTYDMLSRCYILKSYDPEMNEDKFDEVIRKIVYLRNDLILRINHPETDAESKNLKIHYRKVKEDMYELLGVIEELNTKQD
ncbi:MAG: hypothetical protein WD052_12325 [Bacteroidales bacterium]